MKLVLNDVTSFVNSAVVTVNDNMASIENAFENTLSRDGTAPNMMEADFDMNSFHILNLPLPSDAQHAVNKEYVDSLIVGEFAAPTGASAVGFNPVGTIAADNVQAAIEEVATEASADLDAVETAIQDQIDDLTIGTDVQAWDANLDQIAALTPTDSNIIVGNGSAWVAESGATARTSLGAASTDSATTDATGLVELATQAEMDAGTAGKVPTTDLNKIALGTPIATTSGTAHDFTIPAGARKITGLCSVISLNGTANLRFQIGDSGGIKTTGYGGSYANHGSGAVTLLPGAGFDIPFGVTTETFSGVFNLTLMNASTNLWMCEAHFCSESTSAMFSMVGTKTLSAALDRVRFTTSNGTDTFDAGSVNIAFER